MSGSHKNIDQLLTDDSFVQWINGEAGRTERKKWNRWLRNDPARKHTVRQARELYSSLQFKEEVPDTIGELNRLRSTINSDEVRIKKYDGPVRKRSYYWASAAAIMMLLLTVMLVVQYAGWQPAVQQAEEKPVLTTVRTEYGQIRRLTLWDGSKIILNANSSLTYPATYKGGNIEVKLEGEAYFSIIHKTDEQERTFSVRTSEGEIAVLGTRFNINTHCGDTEVVLEEGKVQLEAADSLSAAKATYFYTMKPGERALLSPQRKGIKVETTDPELYTSWRNLELKFRNTPLKEIAGRIEQTYGVQVEFKNKRIRELQFSGSAPNKNFAVLLEGLRTLLDIPISYEGNKITFGG